VTAYADASRFVTPHAKSSQLGHAERRGATSVVTPHVKSSQRVVSKRGSVKAPPSQPATHAIFPAALVLDVKPYRTVVVLAVAIAADVRVTPSQLGLRAYFDRTPCEQRVASEGVRVRSMICMQSQ